DVLRLQVGQECFPTSERNISGCSFREKRVPLPTLAFVCEFVLLSASGPPLFFQSFFTHKL
ncbi:TPA: hypothetical protein ACG5Q1_005261, partial [Escherichia coli]